MKKKLKRYRLKINPEKGSVVDFISQVESPAIEVGFLKFEEQLKIMPGSSESEQEWISRCIPFHVKEGYEQSQAAAMCYSMWERRNQTSQQFDENKISFDFDDTLSTERGQKKAEELIAQGKTIYVISARDNKEGMLNITRKLGIPDERVFATGSNSAKVAKVKELNIGTHYDNNVDVVKNLDTIGIKFNEELESYSDYPEAAKENAKRAIRLNEEMNNKCATQVGKVRAQQIANGEPLSKETITRTYSYLSRASAYYKPNDTEACGTISYLLWGGDEMLRWAESKMNNEDFIRAKMASQENEDKMELFGPVLIPDLPIYRYSEKMGEYEIIFKREDIKEIAMNFMKSGYQNNINLDHSSEMASSFVFESFISDEMIPNPKAYEDLPLGTWFVRMKVEDEKVWKEIKEGKRNGFSIEGIFEYMVEEFEKSYQKEEKQSTNKLSKEEKLNLEKMIKDLFRKIFTELSQELDENAEGLSDYQMVASSDYKIEAREVGQKVEVVDAQGNLMPAPDGDYEFEDGFKFSVSNGVISEIDGVEEAPQSDMPAEQPVDAGKDYKKQLMDTLAEYPWDQCMLDMEKEGYTEEQAQRICGSIKWNNMEDEKMSSIEKQKEIENLKEEIAEIKSAMISKDEIIEQLNSIKTEFKSVFEKFSQLPAEPSKVSTNISKDIEKRKFEEYLHTIRKSKN